MQRCIEVTCPQCGAWVHATATQRGGMVNCPQCRGIVKIPDKFEWLFWMPVSCGGALGAVSSVAAFAFGGPFVGAAVLALCVLVLAIVVLAL